MAIRIYNHISKIQRSQPAKIKAVHPGMFIRFKYRKKYDSLFIIDFRITTRTVQ